MNYNVICGPEAARNARPVDVIICIGAAAYAGLLSIIEARLGGPLRFLGCLIQLFVKRIDIDHPMAELHYTCSPGQRVLHRVKSGS